MKLALLAVEILAIAAVVYGIALVFVPAAWIVGGLAVTAMVEQRA